MPELPEVEVLVRHLDPLLNGRVVRQVEVRRPRVIRPLNADALRAGLIGRRIGRTTRRAKYLVFELSEAPGRPAQLIGHLGMAGRMFLQPSDHPLPKHATVTFDLGAERFVFEDTRYFGRLNFDHQALADLGPEPLDASWTPAAFALALRGSRQPVKVKLLDQQLVAGVGNIYASEALFRAGLSPRRPADSLKDPEVERLWSAVREVLNEAIAAGSTLPLDFAEGQGGLFYYGAQVLAETAASETAYFERLRVYDREGEPCERCCTPIRRFVQAQRSTYYCPQCQPTTTGRRGSSKD